MSTIYFYKIVCKNPNIKYVYVGNTNNFNKRKIKHKSLCNNPNSKMYNIKVYQIIRENEGWENWEIIEIEKRFCINNTECRQIEQNHILSLNANMNTNKAYNDLNKKQREKYNKYYIDNADKIKEIQKQKRIYENKKLVYEINEVNKNSNLIIVDKLEKSFIKLENSFIKLNDILQIINEEFILYKLQKNHLKYFFKTNDIYKEYYKDRKRINNVDYRNILMGFKIKSVNEDEDIKTN